MEDNGYEHLGFYSLALLYLFLGIGSLFSTAIIDKIGVKYCLITGCLCDILWIVSSIPPSMKSKHPESTSYYVSDSFIYQS